MICKGADTLTTLAQGFCFGEGPRWFEGLLWFSDMLGEAVYTANLRGDLTTLPLPGHHPSGLGFRPDGTLLIVSGELRRLLRYDGYTVEPIASALTQRDRLVEIQKRVAVERLHNPHLVDSRTLRA